MGDFDFKTTSFEFKGFKELLSAIDHLPEVVKKKELAPLMAKSLEPMRDTARHLAPDDPRTGPPWDLPSSIEVSSKRRGGLKTNDPKGRYVAVAYMGPTKYGYPQAMMQEFGTLNMVATPFMRPAWDHDKEKAMGIIQDGLGERLRMIIRKHGAKQE